MVLRIDHRTGAPPATGDVLGTWGLPRGRGTLVAVLAPAAVVACHWPRRPRGRRLVRWYARRVVPDLHAAIVQRWGLDAGASLHVVAPSAATAAAWAAEFAAAQRGGLH